MKKMILVVLFAILAMGLFAMDHVSGKVQTNTGDPLSAEVTIYCLTPYGWMEISDWNVPNNPDTGYYNIELYDYICPGFRYKAKAVLADGRTASKIWTTTSGSQYGINITFLPTAQY